MSDQDLIKFRLSLLLIGSQIIKLRLSIFISSSERTFSSRKKGRFFAISLLKYSRKKLTRQAREALPAELNAYYDRLSVFYQYPSQIIFADETSKDQRAAIRHYAYSPINTPAVVRLPQSRGTRISAFASFTTDGFLAWTTTTGTFDRHEFHRAFMTVIYPFLNPWPLPRSIVILDNAKIHMYPELEKMVWN